MKETLFSQQTGTKIDPKPWEIWFASMIFEDRPEEFKDRPVLVISPDNLIVLSIKITSHEPRPKYWGEYPIKKWQEAGLTKQSTVRLSKKAKIPLKNFKRKIGKLHTLDITAIKNIMRQKKH